MSSPALAPWRTRDGREVWLVARAELEGAPGWRLTHGGRRGRGACVMHGGDNRDAMDADLETGWITCRTRGCLGRLADHPETYGAGDGRPAYGAPLEPGGVAAHRQHIGGCEGRPRGGEDLRKPEADAPAGDRLTELGAALERIAAALPGSPGAAYLERRRIPLDVAARHGLGWATRGALRGRLVFPLTDPTGRPTSATGRVVDPGLEPRYRTLPAADYPKGWHNAGAIAAARSSGAPVYLCEGPFDALALDAGGIGTAVAMLGTDPGRLAAWLAGVPQVIVCLDADEAGQAAARKVAAELALWTDVRILAPVALGDCGDLAEYWERHGALPADLLTPPGPRPVGELAGGPSLGGADDQTEQFGHLKKGTVPADGLLELAELAATDIVPTPLPAYPLTCPEALALELAGGAAAYAVDWADELAALAPEELEAYAARMAGCGPMGQAAILETRYRTATASPAEVAA